jgi:hypothetical protein
MRKKNVLRNCHTPDRVVDFGGVGAVSGSSAGKAWH